MRTLILLFCLIFPVVVFSQEADSLLTKTRKPIQDSIQVDTLSINPYQFEVRTSQGKLISSEAYKVDYGKGILIPSEELLATEEILEIRYRKYPKHLTKNYRQFDPKLIIDKPRSEKGLYQLNETKDADNYKPFDGLNTTGSISRGITTGTNQNSVLDSKLDLQITGKISEDVNIRASIQDSDIPIKENGYSQNLNEFDQIFIEIYSDYWNIRGGDIDLEQNESYFGNFQKKVQGLSVGANLNPEGNETDVFGAGALVRGVFTRNEFSGQEGNQGPYKLTGPNGETFALIVSGSENVYVNGVRLKRGEEEDYTIDYNAGEIRFNPTYPITSEMRITVEFQYSDRNYTRIAATAGAEHREKDWEVGGFVYNESDLKNQPLQQDLTDEQKQVLADAGDNEEDMYAPSAFPDDFSENKVLYKKEDQDGIEIYVHSTDEEEDLYQVKFSNVGSNNGNYVIADETSIAKIYEYIPPEDGVPQGSYEPITQLHPPTKLQLAVINGGYHPSEKTDLKFELAGSSYDQNLFSDKDKGDNEAVAGHFEGRQRLITTEDTTQINAFAKLDYVQDNFESIEPLYNVEFGRDWNLVEETGDQALIDAGVEYTQPKKGFARYNFQHLDYAKNYSGSRHVLNSRLHFGDFSTRINGSYMENNSKKFSSEFSRINTQARYDFKKMWTGAVFDMEDNQQRDSINQLTELSQQYQNYEVFTGIGDSTDVYAEAGYRYRVTDSLRNTQMQRVNSSHNYYLKSQLINSENSMLSLYANYRTINHKDSIQEKEKSLNSRLQYQQFIFNKVVSLNTTYETNSGNLPQQEYTFVEVDPGKGEYTWNDYNGDGVQDLDEFEISPYPDEANYVRVLLPNQIFIKVRENRLSQILNLNFQQLRQEKGADYWLTHFYNQTSYIIDRKVERDGNNFNLNPFSAKGGELAGNTNFRNTVFFNRGRQHLSTSYTYLTSTTKNLLATGLQENTLESHQIDFNHQFNETWQTKFKSELNHSGNTSEQFHNRDYRIKGYKINPKISYYLNEDTRFDVFYKYYQRHNRIGEEEQLNQQNLGASFDFSKEQKFSLNGEFNYIYNNFSGDSFSPVAYEMLQGLKEDKNFTWQVLFQKKITDFLDLNLSYYGRKSKESPMIHTGSVQLKAYF